MSQYASDEAAARGLLSAHAVRERAHEMLAAALAGEVAEWRVDLAKLEAAADLTAQTSKFQRRGPACRSGHGIEE